MEKDLDARNTQGNALSTAGSDASASPREVLAGLSVAIIGHTGFVGGTLSGHLPGAACFNSKNIDAIAGQAFDIIICCGLPATRWWINQHPDEDAANMGHLQAALSKAECRAGFVLVSTIDVYDVARLHQTEAVVQPAQHAYGKHRLQMEEWAVACYGADKVAIIRLPGLFGVGLKKNIIFDLLNDNMAGFVCNHHTLQLYDTADLYADIVACIFDQGGVTSAAPTFKPGVRNFFTEPVTTAELVDAIFPEHRSTIEANMAKEPVTYDIRTAHTVAGYWADKASVLAKLGAYVRLQRKLARGGGGKVQTVSNLA